MATRVSRSVTIRCSHQQVAAFVTDPHQALPVIPGFGRFDFVGPAEDPAEELWDVFLDVGTLHIGGRVVVRKASVNRLEWRSVRGTRHRFAMNVEPVGEHARLTMTLEYSFSGLLMARISERLGRGIAGRHLDAGLQQVRHRLEFGEAPARE